MSSADHAKSIKDQIDNYYQTVTAIWALISVFTWDDGNKALRRDRHHSVGRKMTRIGNAAGFVTPDVVVQLSSTLGVVAEAKRTLPADQTHWSAVLQQLESYDVDLEGWWTRNHRLEHHDITLLIHQFHGPAFAEFVEGVATKRKLRFRRPLGIIEFGLVTQVAQRVHLVLRRGALRDRAANDALKRGIAIPLERIVASHGQKAFYDSPPVAEHIMEKVWMDFVVRGAAGQARGEGQRHVEVVLSVAEVTRELQRAYGAVGGQEREAEYPRVSWVRAAMDRFVGLRLARRVDGDNYVVLYRHLRGDIVERFATVPERKRGRARPRGGRRRRRGEGAGTLPLFPE